MGPKEEWGGSWGGGGKASHTAAKIFHIKSESHNDGSCRMWPRFHIVLHSLTPLLLPFHLGGDHVYTIYKCFLVDLD